MLPARHGTVTNVRMRQALGVTGLTPRHAVTLMNLEESGPMGRQALPLTAQEPASRYSSRRRRL